MSGEVVVSKEDSRGEITATCKGGNASIERMLMSDWLKRIHPEGQVIAAAYRRRGGVKTYSLLYFA